MDLTNGLFEILGTLFMIPAIRSVYHTRSSAGAHWLTAFFFTSWGCWNLFYYPHLGQWYSTLGAAVLAFTNAFYLFLLVKYRKT